MRRIRCLALDATFTALNVGLHITGHAGPVETLTDHVQGLVLLKVAHLVVKTSEGNIVRYSWQNELK